MTSRSSARASVARGRASPAESSALRGESRRVAAELLVNGDDLGWRNLVIANAEVRQDRGVWFVNISAPPMNLIGTELVRDLVSLIQRAEADDACHVLVFASADPDYFISHVDVTRIGEYRDQAAKLAGEAVARPAVSLLEHQPARDHRANRGTSARRRERVRVGV